jgi:ribosome-associated translation inhibitor RaiA
MTTHSTQETPLVRLRSDGTVDEETLAYARTKIDAVVGRPGLPVVTGEVHIVRAAAHHADRPWSATADLRIGGRHVVAAAEEATGTEAVDRLQDRLRRQTEKASQAWGNGHRTTAPPWRGATERPSAAAGPGSTAEDSPTA